MSSVILALLSFIQVLAHMYLSVQPQSAPSGWSIAVKQLHTDTSVVRITTDLQTDGQTNP